MRIRTILIGLAALIVPISSAYSQDEFTLHPLEGALNCQAVISTRTGEPLIQTLNGGKQRAFLVGVSGACPKEYQGITAFQIGAYNVESHIFSGRNLQGRKVAVYWNKGRYMFRWEPEKKK